MTTTPGSSLGERENLAAMLALSLCVGPAALAAPDLIWDNGWADDWQAVYFSMLDETYPFQCQVADDFLLIEQNPFVLSLIHI